MFLNGLDIYHKTKPLSNFLSLVLNFLFYIFQAICLFYLAVNSLLGLMIVPYLLVSILQQRLIWLYGCFFFFLTSDKWLEKETRDFPGGPAAKTLSSQCRGPRFDPWSGS